MSTSIDQAFIINFDSEVKAAYQQMGSKLRNTVRTKTAVVGEKTTFQTVGKGTASGKTRHGEVPVMNIDHKPVECMLEDSYAGEWVDKLDQLKTNIDEMQVVAKAGSYALGRKTDELIITKAATATQASAANNVGLVRAQVLEAFETLGNNDVPDDGDWYALVSPNGWSWLMCMKEFVNADYVGPGDLPWIRKGTQAKYWNGALWIRHTGLPKTGNVRTNLLYHKTAVGHAIAADIMTDITWHGDRAAHFINSMMSQGACLIDPKGVFKLLHDESVALPSS